MSHREPGDAMISTRLGWPAIWWYGDIPIGADDVARGRMRDGGPMLQVRAGGPGPECDTDLREALKGRRRVLVYLGFPDYPYGFPSLLMQRLEALGSRVAYQRFAEIGEGEIIDLDPAALDRPPVTPQRDDARNSGRFSGCIEVTPAVRW